MDCVSNRRIRSYTGIKIPAVTLHLVGDQLVSPRGLHAEQRHVTAAGRHLIQGFAHGLSDIVFRGLRGIHKLGVKTADKAKLMADFFFQFCRMVGDMHQVGGGAAHIGDFLHDRREISAAVMLINNAVGSDHVNDPLQMGF